MKRYLADTNVLSEWLRKRPDPAVIGRLEALSPDSLFSSEITRFELKYGACLHPDGEALWQRIERRILPRVTWLAFDESASTATAALLAMMKKSGTPIGPWDTCIAGTALANGMTVATRNISHFRQVPGLNVENWFSP
jgi:predicted nucleic acid-binding protein